MTVRREIIAVFVILAIAAFLRFYRLPSFPPGLYPDEAMNGNNALEALDTGNFKVFYPENNGREGLFINIQALALRLTGFNEPWVLRFPSAVFGTLTVLGLFFLLWELSLLAKLESPGWVAFLGSFFMATSVWHVIFSRIGFRAIMAPLFLVWAIYFFLFAFKKHRWRYAVISGIALGLGAYSYIAYRIMPLVFLPLVSALYKRRAFGHMILGAAISAAIVVLPLMTYFAYKPSDFLGRTSQVSIFSSQTPLTDLAKNIGLTAAMFNIHGDANWRHNISGSPQLFWPVGILFLYGVWVAARRRSIFDVMMVWWLALATLPVVISNEGLPHALRSILMIPAVMGLSASGAVKFFSYLHSRLGKAEFRIGFAAFLVLLIWQSYHAYFVVWGPSREVAGAFSANYVGTARRINELAPDADKYVVVRASSVDVRGIPMSVQTVMFLTDSFLPEMQRAKNIHYLTRSQYEAEKFKLPEARIFFVD